MTDDSDYYTVLGVGRNATLQEISHAYRGLMRSHHPDMDGGTTGGGGDPKRDEPVKERDPAQGDELLRIMHAFNVLRDPERRAAYDRKLAGAPVIIPVRRVRSAGGPAGPAIRATPVRWESGPWS